MVLDIGEAFQTSSAEIGVDTTSRRRHNVCFLLRLLNSILSILPCVLQANLAFDFAVCRLSVVTTPLSLSVTCSRRAFMI